MKKLIEIAVIAASLGAAFLVINFVHFQTFEVSVILYACTLDAVIASIVVLPLFWVFRRKRSVLSVTEFAQAAVIGNLLIAVYAIMGPTVIDRSLSIYIVEKLNSRGGEISYASFGQVIDREFMAEYHVADVRLTEQIASGTAKIEDGCIVLTERGRFVASLTDWYRKTFLPKKRRLLTEVTDRLTDPLKGSVVLVDTRCRSR